jgi:hypothetical protein
MSRFSLTALFAVAAAYSAAWAQPVNDACSGALLVTCGSQAIYNNNLASTEFGNDPNVTCSFGGPHPGDATVWFRFVSTGTSATVSLCPLIAGGIDDTLMALYRFTNSGNPCASLEEVTCNDDSCGLGSRFTATSLTPGETYYIKVAAWQGAADPEGNFRLTLTCPPPTGACCATAGCRIDTQSNCVSSGGTYQGDGTDCGGPRYQINTGGPPLEDISTTGTLSTVTGHDDGIQNAIPMGMTFPYYGNNFTTVSISANGVIAFGNIARPLAVNESIPSSLLPNNLIAPFWDDLTPDPNFAVGCSVRYELRAAPQRFIVQWTNVPQFADIDSNTFQVVLFASGEFDLRYGTITPQAQPADYSIGFENGDATLFGVISPPTLGGGNTTRHVAIVSPPNPCSAGCPLPGCVDGPVDADFDGNCEVNLSDLATQLIHFGAGGGQTNATGDTDGDGDIDLVDLANLLIRFGSICH